MEGKVACARNSLQLYVTFNCGQCYRWKCQPDSSWIGVFNHCVWRIKHENDTLVYKVYGNIQKLVTAVDKTAKTFFDYCIAFNISESDITDEVIVGYFVWDYFRLFENLEGHYERWSLCDFNFKEKADKFHGLRMLKQDSEEILFTFICSSNTTISRIAKMVETLCLLYGKTICEVDGVLYYDFPEACSMASPLVVQNLRKAKFGYRAEYVVNSARKIMEMGGAKWFKRLNGMNHNNAKMEMMKLPGIGEKVADCVCLMGLNHLDAIPVDTHVFQISKQYIPALGDKKTVNKTIYKQIGDFFRALFGHHAGWAHVVLFCADLKMHQSGNKGGKVTKRTKSQVSKTVVSKYFQTRKKNPNTCCVLTD